MRLKQTIFTVLFLIGANAQAFQGSCTNVTLDESRMGPVRQQGNYAGWCYAITAADLISYRFGIRVSTIDVASAFNYKFGSHTDRDEIVPGVKQGGQIDEALEAVQERGFCPEGFIHSERYSGRSDNSVKTADDDIGIVLKTISEGQRLGLRSKVGCSYLLYGIEAILGAHSAEIGAVMKILDKSSGPKAWYDVVQKACEGHRFRKKDRSFNVVKVTNEKQLFFQSYKIDQQLNNHNPVGIAYDTVDLANDGSGEFGYFNPPKHLRAASHASTIIGRRYNVEKRRCEYEIRGTDPRQCDNISGFTWDAKKKTWTDDGKTCFGGHTWVASDDLFENLSYVTYLE